MKPETKTEKHTMKTYFATVHPSSASTLFGKTYKTRPCKTRAAAEKAGWDKAANLSVQEGGDPNARGWEVTVKDK